MFVRFISAAVTLEGRWDSSQFLQGTAPNLFHSGLAWGVVLKYFLSPVLMEPRGRSQLRTARTQRRQGQWDSCSRRSSPCCSPGPCFRVHWGRRRSCRPAPVRAMATKPGTSRQKRRANGLCTFCARYHVFRNVLMPSLFRPIRQLSPREPASHERGGSMRAGIGACGGGAFAQECLYWLQIAHIDTGEHSCRLRINA